MALPTRPVAVRPSGCAEVDLQGGASLERWHYTGHFGTVFFATCLGPDNGTCICATTLDANVTGDGTACGARRYVASCR
jgi:hypothetical protein